MKRLVLFISVISLSIGMHAQTLDDVGRMSIYVTRPTSNNLPTEALDILEDRMEQILTTNGIADNGLDRRFAMTATVSVIEKRIIEGMPTRVLQKLEVVFYIRDVIDNKAYGNVAINTTGVDINENKAFIMAFNNIKPSNSKIQTMIESSKDLIVTYYRTNINNIIADAYLEAKQGNYNHALYILAKVPNVCSDCIEQCRVAILDIYQQKIDNEGANLLQSALAAWNAEPNAMGAVKASEYLAQINLLAACQPQADSLMAEMKTKVLDDERKAWEFAQQQYADAMAREQRDYEFRVRQYEEAEAKEQARHEEELAREKQYHQEELAREQRDFEFEKHKFDSDHTRDMAIIQASREVALEYAKHAK